MIRGTAPQEAWAAIGLLLNDGRARCHWCRPKGIGRTKYRDYRQTNRGRNVHAAGTLSIDRWNGEERVQLRLMDVAPVEHVAR